MSTGARSMPDDVGAALRAARIATAPVPVAASSDPLAGLRIGSLDDELVDVA